MKKAFKIFLLLSLAMNIAMGMYLFRSSDGEGSVELKLSESQLQEVEKLREKYFRENSDLKKKIRDCHRKLVNTLELDIISKDEVYKCVEEINKLQEQIQKNSVDEIICIKKLLNKEQCKCFMTEVSKGLGQEGKCECRNKRHFIKRLK